jgi:hypothetical protein
VALRSPLLITTNLPFSEWTQVFPNARLCKALLDRITDRAHIIETGMESYRFKRTLEKRQKRKNEGGSGGCRWLKLRPPLRPKRVKKRRGGSAPVEA